MMPTEEEIRKAMDNLLEECCHCRIAGYVCPIHKHFQIIWRLFTRALHPEFTHLDP